MVFNNDKNAIKPIPDLGNLNKILEIKWQFNFFRHFILIIAKKMTLPRFVNLPYHFVCVMPEKHLSKEILEENIDEKISDVLYQSINKGIAFSRMKLPII